MNSVAAARTDIAATYGCLLATTEVGLGSLLHGFHIPLSGQFLSLNQGFLLSHGMLVARGLPEVSLLPAGISSVAASLKSLSPAGKKLTPMLAIAMQGWLYSLGIILGGNTLVGRALAAGLSSLWAFVQPLLFVGLVFGLEWQKLYAAGSTYLPTGNVVLAVALIVLAKVLAAVSLSIVAAFLPRERVEAYFGRLNRYAGSARVRVSRSRSSWRGLLRPLFVVPLLITAVVAFRAEGTWVGIAWVLLRPIAVAVLLFVLLRLLSKTAVAERVLLLLPSGYREALQRAWQQFLS